MRIQTDAEKLVAPPTGINVPSTPHISSAKRW